MAWPALAAAGIGALGSYLGGKASQPEAVNPLDAIPGYLQSTYHDLTSQVMGLPMPQYYQGPTVAPLNSDIQRGLARMRQLSSGTGRNVLNEQMLAGRYGGDALSQAYRTTMNFKNQGANKFKYDQGLFNRVMGNLTPGLQGAYNAATRDINRDLNWNQIPGINMANVAAGGMGNTKALQGSALAQGMAQDRAADIGSALWMNAANQANQAAYGAGSQNLDSRNAFRGQILGGFQNAANLGLPQLGNAFQTGTANAQNTLGVGDYLRNITQQKYDANMARWNFNQNRRMDHLRNRLSLIPGPGGYQPAAPSVSPFVQGLYGANAGLNLYSAGQNAGLWGQPQYNVNAPIMQAPTYQPDQWAMSGMDPTLFSMGGQYGLQ